MNVAIVVLDTLRKDAFDEQFDWLPGRRYEHTWSTSHWTAPVHASLFCGAYPSELGVEAKSPTLDTERPTLAERLAEAGYRTRAFSCNPYVSWVFDFDRGFEEFEGNWRLRSLRPDVFDWNRFISDSGDGPLRYPRALYECLRGDCATLPSLRAGLDLKLRDLGVGPMRDDGAAQTLEWLRSTAFGEDEFLFLNLMEAHTPYEPPGEYRSVDAPPVDQLRTSLGQASVDEGATRAIYDDCVRYLSDMYREMFDVLTAEFDYVLTLADHGESLGEDGLWGHWYGAQPALTHVPLVLSGADVEDGTDDTPASLLDVHRTVAELTDIEAGPRGEDLRSLPEDRDVLVESPGLQSHIVERLRSLDPAAIDRYDSRRYGLAYDRCYWYERVDGGRWGTDPCGDPPADRLSAAVDALDPREASEETGRLDDSVMDQLEDLGYA